MNENRVEREAKKRSRRRVRPIVIIVTCAVVAVLATALYVYFSLGWRYIIYENNAKFLGRAPGGVPVIGTVYYPDGKSAKYDAQTETLTYQNGDVYVGELSGFLRHGKGKLVIKLTGDVYEGTFENDQPHGQVKCVFANQDVYVGSFVAGNREGEGTYTWASGATYVGSFKNNLKDGHGFYTAVDGSTYDGEYTADLKNGQGLYRFANGDTYEGTYLNDVRTGYGVYTWANGESYKGNFVSNQIDTRKLDENGEFVKNADGSFAHGEEGVYSWPTDNPDEPKLFTGYFEAGNVVTIDETLTS